MAAESDFNKRVMAALGGHHPCRVENTVGEGTPDINFAGGWIEDKAIAFPKRAATVIKIPHYTTEQRGWHRRRRASGGCCLVALENTTASHVYLFDAWGAAAHLGVDWTEADCRRAALCWTAVWDARLFRNAVLTSVARPRPLR